MKKWNLAMLLLSGMFLVYGLGLVPCSPLAFLAVATNFLSPSAWQPFLWSLFPFGCICCTGFMPGRITKAFTLVLDVLHF